MTSGATDEAGSAAHDDIRAAVLAWLASLDSAQRPAATFPFGVDERFAWDYRPGLRAGLALGDMTGPQRDLAWAVIDAAMSPRGSGEIASIIALEPVLGDLERRAGREDWARRDSDRYWFGVFGDPAGPEPWSWRVGGHHLAIQLTAAGGRIASAAPSFLGANPAVIPDGPRAGQRALTGEERLARELLASLSGAERETAVVDPIAPPDILSGNGRRAEVDGIATGIRHDQLGREPQSGLETLIRHYLERARGEVAEAAWDRIAAEGLAAVTFAWAGPDEPGRGHYYAVRGPRFLIEYDNTQDRANHIHAVWRDLDDDWGEDTLAVHYRSGHPAT